MSSKCADYVIDMGPEGGDRGGNLVIAGTPEQVAACPESHTGRYLKRETPIKGDTKVSKGQKKHKFFYFLRTGDVAVEIQRTKV